MEYTLLVIALISHILGDFVFQPDIVAEGRKLYTRNNRHPYAIPIIFNVVHALIHSFLFLIIDLITRFLTSSKPEDTLILSLVIGVSHFIIDMSKSIINIKEKNKPRNKISLSHKLGIKGSFNYKVLTIFLVDQIFHILAIYLIFSSLKGISVEGIYSYIVSLPSKDTFYNNILVTILITLMCTFATGYFSKLLLFSITKSPIDNEMNDNGAKNGGFLIGILERTLIIISVVTSQYGMIAIILTLKSIARFKKFSEDYFVECFIVGTLVSLIVSIIGGIGILKILIG